MSKAPNYFEHYRNRYSDQAPAISNHLFLSCTLQLFIAVNLTLDHDLETEPWPR